MPNDLQVPYEHLGNCSQLSIDEEIEIEQVAQRLKALEKRVLLFRQGVEGEPGARGRPGIDGKDGRVGPRGPEGPTGPKGEPGQNGKDGRDGTDGKDGQDGERGPRPKHEWEGTKLRFEQVNGAWGRWTDLRGPAGAGGGGGFGGGTSSGSGGGTVDISALLATLDAASDALPSQVVVRQGGEWRRATLEQLIGWIRSGTSQQRAFLMALLDD